MNVGGLQLAEVYDALFESAGKQTANDWQVVDQCRWSETSLRTQKTAVIPNDLVDRIRRSRWRGWYRYATKTTQVLEKHPTGRDLATPTVPRPIERPMEKIQRRFIERRLHRSPIIKPAAETRQLVALFVRRPRRIAKLPEILEESLGMTRQTIAADPDAIRRDCFASLIHGHPPSGLSKIPDRGEQPYIMPSELSVAARNFLIMNENQVRPKRPRNNPALGIMALIPSSELAP
jgi:hypothetical protein